jgi:hypothetical protein
MKDIKSTKKHSEKIEVDNIRWSQAYGTTVERGGLRPPEHLPLPAVRVRCMAPIYICAHPRSRSVSSKGCIIYPLLYYQDSFREVRAGGNKTYSIV